MTYRPLGSSGLMVSALGVGCNAFGRRVDQAGVAAILSAARDTGVTLLDTADIYGGQPGQSESMLGEALRGQRDEFVLATKFGMDMQGANGQDFGALGSRRYVRRAVEASLRRLRTDHLDLYQLHRPDPLTPIEETLEVLSDLVREGKVLYLGCSNFDGWQVADAWWTSSTSGLASFVSVQNEYSLLDRSVEDEVTPACERFGLGILPFFPLARGLLTGKYRRDAAAPQGSRAAVEPERADWLADAEWDRVEALRSFAEERGVDLLDVAIGGLAAQPAVASVIAGATSAEQVTRNARAAAWQPSADDLAVLDEL
jgi:aryl-alcohol dehydrogenase-like predicted oxidoreductase